MLPKNLLTIYGRNALFEALSQPTLNIFALHLSKSNRSSQKLDLIIQLAKKRNIEIKYHTKEQLSYISKNRKQDQGVALDIILENFATAQEFTKLKSFRLLALDGIENPQNMGMIIRSAAAGKIDALIIQKRGSASLVSPLTIKASVGTLFKMPIIYTDSLKKTLQKFDAQIVTLDLSAKESLFEHQLEPRSIFILGNETRGISKEIAALATKKVIVPMNRGVESLNVAATATLISFL